SQRRPVAATPVRRAAAGDTARAKAVRVDEGPARSAWPVGLGLGHVVAIARRELTALFVSPIGWVVSGVFTFLGAGFGFIGSVLAGQRATMDGVFGVITGFLVLVLIPLIT